MKRLILALALITLFVPQMSANNNYSNLWSKVKAAEKAGKPQTAAGYLKELEKKTIEAGDELEHLVVAENLYNDLNEYNWKEARDYWGLYNALRNEILERDIDASIAKYKNHPRVMMLYVHRLEKHKEQVDRKYGAAGYDYLVVRRECSDLLAMNPTEEYRQRIQRVIDVMESKSLYADTNFAILAPSDSIPFDLSTRNQASVDVKVFRLDDNKELSFTEKDPDDILRHNGTLVSQHTVKGLKNEYNISEKAKTSVAINAVGNYVVLFTAGGCNQWQQLHITDVAGAMRWRNGNIELYAADLTTGKPYEGGHWTVFKNAKPDKSGIIDFKSHKHGSFKGGGFVGINVGKADRDLENNYCIRVEEGEDIYAPVMGINFYDRYDRPMSSKRLYSNEVLFTDRALYKPTDTIFFKVICFESNEVSGNVVPNKPVDIILRHSSSRDTIAEVKLVTNEMGSASGFFTLPPDSKNGRYYICDGYTTLKSIRVEEYKRPDFLMTLDRNEDALCIGDAVTQTGQMKSYAGFSVAGASVEYKVVLNSVHCQHYYGSFYSTEVANGTVTADNDGRFKIVFPTKRPEGDWPKDELMSLYYNVYVKVTDPQGETHDQTVSLVVADMPIELDLVLPDNTHFDNKLIVDKDNVKTVLVKAFTLNNVPYDIDGNFKVWDGDKEITSGKFSSNKDIPFDFGALPSGFYKLEASIKYRGLDKTVERYVVVMSTDDKQLPFTTPYFYYPINTSGAIDFVLGTTEEDLYLELELFDGDSCFYREPVHLRNEMRKFSLPYLPSYRSAVKMTVFGFRNGKTISNQYQFTRPGDVRLDVAVETLRDKTSPGEEETMIVRAPAGSELMVSIFDVTTDRFGANSFRFYPLNEYVNVWAPSVRTTFMGGSRYGGEAIAFSKAKAAAPGAAMSGAANTMDMAVMRNAEPMVEEAMAMDDSDGIPGEGGDEDSDVAVRSNLSELIAFYPHIIADASGKTEVKFTPGDLLSTFNVLVMAHNKDLFVGDASGSFIVQKELMVMPSVPLFAMEGDKIILKSKVVNMSDRLLKGTGNIELRDQDGNKLNLKGLAAKPLTLRTGAQDELAWTVTIPENVKKITAKIWFASPTASDGEVHEMQIVPSTVTLTEAASFVIGQGHDHKYYEKQLRDKFKASNPIIKYAEYSTLDAVKESLPKASKPECENAINWINQLYINQMRAYVLKEGGDEYDKFRKDGFERLRTFQAGDGGIKWFQGMQSNTLLTLYFLEKMGQMRSLGALILESGSVEAKMVDNALGYLDKVLDNADREKFDAFAYTREFAIRSLWFDHPLSSGADKAFKRYIKETEEKWQKIAILQKAYMINTFLRCEGTAYGSKELTKRVKILRESLSDYAVENPTIGYYFPNAVMPFRGLMNSEIYAHAQLMETFSALGEKKLVNGIAQWMLLQKHNQAWESTVATTDAVHALVASNASDLKLGAVYYTYTTKMPQVKSSGDQLKVNRTFSRNGVTLKDGDLLKVGDKIEARYSIHNSENRSFVQLTAQRPAAFYPQDERSYYTWYGYYREVKPSQTNFYWELLPEENSSVSETFFVTQEGVFCSGLIEIECLYAPEYRGHTNAVTVATKK